MDDKPVVSMRPTCCASAAMDHVWSHRAGPLSRLRRLQALLACALLTRDHALDASALQPRDRCRDRASDPERVRRHIGDFNLGSACPGVADFIQVLFNQLFGFDSLFWLQPVISRRVQRPVRSRIWFHRQRAAHGHAVLLERRKKRQPRTEDCPAHINRIPGTLDEKWRRA